MGLRGDTERFEEIGENRRKDLEEYIEEGDLSNDEIKIPIKIIDLPEFEFSPFDQGGVGQGEGEPGDPVQADPDGDEDGEAGEDGGEHGYYEMDPEEFAERLDDRLGLDLDPKGKSVVRTVEGDHTDTSRQGTESTLDIDRLFKKGLKRKKAYQFDEDYLREVMRVAGMGPDTVFKWARKRSIPVSKQWIENEYENIENRTKYTSVEEIPSERGVQTQVGVEMKDVPIRSEDKRYRYPEVVEKEERNVVVVNIRDVSGSMRDRKKELVERVFTPLDWYLTGKYDNAEFIYIAHDAEAWEVDREDFFGIDSGGGTKISSAYELAKKLLEKRYPWHKWNRYVFAAGDGENSGSDSRKNVVPLMESIDANMHAYLSVGGASRYSRGKHGKIVKDELGDRDNVVVSEVSGKDGVVDAIEEILSTEDNDE